MIKIYYSETAKEAGKLAAEVIKNAVNTNPEATLGLATGSSPLEMYAALADMYNKGEVSFKNVKSVNLDEYVGLTPDHDQSYAYFMKKNLFDNIDILAENTNIPSGVANDPEAERARYDALLDSIGGVDVQVLGIGNNGHIGFNEPSDIFSYGTILVDLTDSTIDANQRFFASRDEVPKQAISMGIGHIMTAKTIVLLANGKGKAEILERSLFGEVTPSVPASILRFAKDVRVFADKEALSVIMEKHPEALIK
jgi:glucosamine-6-phosphate deaminase